MAAIRFAFVATLQIDGVYTVEFAGCIPIYRMISRLFASHVGWSIFIGCGQMDERVGDSTVVEKQASRVKPPPVYQVVLLNDDYTPMEFVVGVLQKFFGKGREKATQIMLKVHHEGRGVCGCFPRDIAATKVEQVGSYSRQHQHTLQCVMEEA